MELVYAAALLGLLALAVGGERRGTGWGALALGVFFALLLARPLLDLDPRMILAVREAEWTIEGNVLAIESLFTFRELPLWNPYWFMGRPLLADPFFHLLDPKMLLPILLLGPLNGAKVGIALSFVVMGVGGWWLGRSLGLAGPARGWLAVMMALNGHLIGYYSTVGSIGLGLSFSYLPWLLAAALDLWEAPSGRRMAWLALAAALLFLGSNTYFAAYGAVTLLLLGIGEGLWALAARRTARFLRFAAYGVGAAGLAAGLAAVTLLPQIELSRYLFKPPLDELHPFGQPVEALLLNFVIGDPAYYATPLFNLYGAMIGHYSYISWLPFLFLIALPLRWRVGGRRPMLWLGAVAAIGLAYAAGSHTPLWPLFRALPGVGWLRFPERALGLASVAFLGLGALGLDGAWRAATAHPSEGLRAGERNGRRLAQTLLLLLAAAAPALAWQSNAPHLRLVPRATAVDAWLVAQRAQWEGRAIHLHVPIDFSLIATTRAGTGQVNAPLAWTLDRPPPLLDWVVLMHRGAEFAIAREGERPPEQMGPVTALSTGPGFALYRVEQAMPYAFTLDAGVRAEESVWLPDRHVTPQIARRPTPRTLRLQVTLDAPQRLVVAESDYPGWRATVNGRPVAIEPFNGLLALSLPAGRHEVAFRFDPWLPRLSLPVSLLSLLLFALLIGPRPRFWHSDS